MSDRPPQFLTKPGLAATVLRQSPQYCQYPIACIALWAEPAIWHDQIHIFHNEIGVAVGYMTWAWLTEETESRLIHDANVLLHISEWNE